MVEIRPIPVNPGGVLALEHIVGRDAACAEILGILEHRSVVLTGERRLGKTSLSRLLAHLAPDRGWTVVRFSTEGLGSLDELSETLIAKVRAAEIAIELPAGTGLEDTVKASIGTCEGRLLLILDELPLFARALNDRDPAAADGTRALHVLRRLREGEPDVRMLCLGSIGFHHVVRDASGVLNNAEPIRLQPLTHGNGSGTAEYLASCLLFGAGLQVGDGSNLPGTIAGEVDGIPYYVHRVVSALTRIQPARPVVEDDVREIVARALTSPDDPWNLRHYRDRIGPWYRDDATLACAILDAVAHSADAVDFPMLLRIIRASPAGEGVDEMHFVDVLQRLEDDHYLVRERETRRFAFELVRRAWIELRR